LIDSIVESSKIIESISPEFIMANHYFRNTFGNGMIYDKPGWDWLVGIFLDRNPYKLFMKAVQGGLTDMAMNWALTMARKGLSGAYVFADNVKRDQFVKDRLKRLISRSKYIADAIGDADNYNIKHFWDATLYFIGSNMTKDFESFTAQFYVIDEYDSCDIDNLQYLDDRVSNTKRLTGIDPPWLKIGNPRAGNRGISAEYELSRKYRWFVKCDHCNKSQPLDWFGNVVRQVDDNTFSLRDLTHSPSQGGGGEPCAFCRFCNKPIDRLSRGEWVAEFPDRDVSGYQISMLFTNQYTINQLWIYFSKGMTNQTAMGHFYSSYLGLPYEGEGDKLTFEVLDSCTDDYTLPMAAKGTIAGVDPGKVWHVTIWKPEDGRLRLMYAGYVSEPETELPKLFKRYGVNNYAVESEPEMHLAKKIVKNIPGGYLVDYRSKDSANFDIKDIKHRKNKLIPANRTETIDRMVGGFYDQRMIIPRNWRDIAEGEFKIHMMAPVRQTELQGKPPKPVEVWREGNKPDHLFHSTNFAYMAAEMMGFSSRPFGGMII